MTGARPSKADVHRAARQLRQLLASAEQAMEAGNDAQAAIYGGDLPMQALAVSRYLTARRDAPR